MTVTPIKLNKGVCVCVCVCVHAQLCSTLLDPTDHGLPGSSIHGIFLRQEYWSAFAISSPRDCSWPRERTCISCIGRWVLYHWAAWEVLKEKDNGWTFLFLGGVTPHHMWNLRSRDRTRTPALECGVLATGPPGKSLDEILKWTVD